MLTVENLLAICDIADFPVTINGKPLLAIVDCEDMFELLSEIPDTLDEDVSIRSDHSQFQTNILASELRARLKGDIDNNFTSDGVQIFFQVDKEPVLYARLRSGVMDLITTKEVA